MFWCYLVMIFRLLNYWRLIDWWMILNLLHCSLLLILHYSLLTFTKHVVFLSFLFLFFKMLLSCRKGKIFLFNVKNIFFFHHTCLLFFFLLLDSLSLFSCWFYSIFLLASTKIILLLCYLLLTLDYTCSLHFHVCNEPSWSIKKGQLILTVKKNIFNLHENNMRLKIYIKLNK